MFEFSRFFLYLILFSLIVFLGLINVFGLVVDEPYVYAYELAGTLGNFGHGGKCTGFLLPTDVVYGGEMFEYCLGKTSDGFNWVE